MNDAITLIKRRGKDGEIGPWEILISPDESIAAHIDAWTPHSYNVTSEEVAEIRCCRLSDLQRKLSFPTKAEAETERKAQEKFSKLQRKSADDAVERQRKLDSEEAEKETARRTSAVEAMNKQHDVIRTSKTN